MKKIKYLIALTDEQRMLFKRLFEDRANTTVDLAYLRKSVTVLVYRGDLPIGGFCINGKGFRYLSVFSENWQKQDLLESENLTEKELLEVTCIWTRSEATNFESISVYSIMLYITVRYAKEHNKKIVLGGSVIQKIQQIQVKSLPKVLYSGFITKDMRHIGHETRKKLMLYYNTIWGFVFNTAKQILLRMVKPKSKSTSTVPQARKGERPKPQVLTRLKKRPATKK